MRKHPLKTVNPHFSNVWDGKKTFEVRKDDRGFRVGDYLNLIEYDPTGQTNPNRFISAEVIHILAAADFPDGVKDGYVVMSINVIAKAAVQSD